MTELQRKNKELCEEYPYLIVRSVWTDKIPEDYDYSYTLADHCLPSGWSKLFLMCCEDIKRPLINDNYLDKFRFTQIKEKYNRMCLYNNGCSQAVLDILSKYEYVSQFICQKCGKPAVYQTNTGWIASYCEDCLPDHQKGNVEKIEFDPIMRVIRFGNGVKTVLEYDVSDIWNRLYEA